MAKTSNNDRQIHLKRAKINNDIKLVFTEIFNQKVVMNIC